MEIVFDSNRPITLRLRKPNETVAVKVRFPSDDEWLERQRRRKVIVKQLGRGQSETTIPNGEDVDAALFAKIRTDETQLDLDSFDCQKLLEQLSVADVEDVTQIGDTYVIAMRVLGGSVTHTLKMPSTKDVSGYRRSFARVVDLPYGKQELTLNLRAAADLYAKLAEPPVGYATPVPVIHQAVAVKAAVDALDTFFQDGSDVNFG